MNNKERQIEIANKLNEKTANLKNYQLKKGGLRLRQIAKEALENPIVCTVNELKKRYPDIFGCSKFEAVAGHDPEEEFVWIVGYAKPPYHKTDKVDISIYPL